MHQQLPVGGAIFYNNAFSGGHEAALKAQVKTSGAKLCNLFTLFIIKCLEKTLFPALHTAKMPVKILP
jgi:hypothetical protein